MTFDEILAQTLDLLQRQGRISYRAIKRRFALDDDYLEDLKAEIIKAQRLAVDEDGEVLVWTGDAGSSPAPAQSPCAPHTPTRPRTWPRKSSPPAAALEGERKQVTVLFADLKGSMELLADRDPEEARQLLDPVLERMMAAVHRYEGTVNQVMGDGIMALFGAPIAHEDHAVRACYAALAMQEAIRRYSAEVRRAHGLEVQIRVGLNSGEVVVRAIGNDLHMDYSAIGQTTHLAARMEQLAPPGSIRLTAETLRLAEGWVQVTPLGPVPVKGLPEPVEVCELVGAGPARTRLQAFAARGLTPFVGRQTELAALHQALEQAGAGHGQVVAVIGEPGVGKTRLFHEFTHASHTQGWLLLESSSTSYGKATPYLPVIDLLKAYFQIEDRDDGRRIREKLTGRLLTLDPGPRADLAGPPGPPGGAGGGSHWQALDPSQRRQRTLDALKRLLLRESQVQPLAAGLRESALDRCRDPGVPRWPGGEPARRPPAPAGQLPPRVSARLGPEDLLHPAPARPAAPGECRGHAAEPPGGRCRSGAAQTALDRAHPGESLLSGGERADPGGNAGAGRRAGGLSPGQGAAEYPGASHGAGGAGGAHRPAAAGGETALYKPPPSSARRCPWRSSRPWPSCPRSRSAWASPICRPPSSSTRRASSPSIEYTFKHALTQQVAYETLLQERRRALHARIVEALEALAGERVAEQVERLAHHALRGEVWDKALAYCRQAGEKAMARSAHREAVGSFEQALSALQHLPEQRDTREQAIDLRLALRSALWPSGDLGRILAYLREAEALAEALDDPRRLAQVSLFLSDHFRFMGAYDQAIAAAPARPGARHGRRGCRPARAGEPYLGLAYQAQGDYRRAIDCLGQTVASLDGARRHERFGQVILPAVHSRA